MLKKIYSYVFSCDECNKQLIVHASNRQHAWCLAKEHSWSVEVEEPDYESPAYVLSKEKHLCDDCSNLTDDVPQYMWSEDLKEELIKILTENVKGE